MKDVNRVQLHVIRDNTLREGSIQGSFHLGLGQDRNLQIVAVVRVVIIVELQDVDECVLSVLKSLANVVQIELLDAVQDVSERLGALIRESTVDRLNRDQSSEVAEKLVGVEADVILLVEFL